MSNPSCTDAAPCADCLAMSNVFEVDMDDATHLRTLDPRREETDTWKGNLRRLLSTLAGTRTLSRTRFNALARLADAAYMIGWRG